MFEWFNKAFKIEEYQAGSSDEEIGSMRKACPIEIPPEFIEIIKTASEIEISVMDERYIRIWGAAGCVEMNEAYQIRKYIPRSWAIGDDGGGNAIIYMTGEKGKGVYAIPFGDLCVEDAYYLSPSLRDFFGDENGARVFTEF